MSTNEPEAAYEEARRRIQAAKDSGQRYLDLGDLYALERLPEEIGELRKLRVLGLGNYVWEDEAREWRNKFLRRRGSLSDLGPLKNLTRLKALGLNFLPVSDLSPLAGVTSLTSLNVMSTKVSDLRPVAGLTSLTSLDVSATSVRDLSSVAGLTSLTSLGVFRAFVSDLSPLVGLTALTSLDVSSTRVSDLSPLAGLTALTLLDVSGTRVSDLSPLVGLTSLTSLDVSSTSVSDLSSVAGLTSLTSLHMSGNPVSDLSPLAGLTSLTSLDVSDTRVSNLSPLARLKVLTLLDVNDTQVSDLCPVKGLTSLTSLNVMSTRVSNLSSVAGLTALTSLNVSYTQVSDVSPVSRLTALTSLDVDGCTCLGDWASLRRHPTLERLHAWEAGPAVLSPDLVDSLPALRRLYVDKMADAPPEVLSDRSYNSCLDSFRSWRADLQEGEVKDQEVKLFVLGNGTAGKTQICRCLKGEGYDARIPSTHGVQIGSFEVMADREKGAVSARLWDFGGQDIYHGTHALFLEGRAVFLLVWNPQLEGAGKYEESGLALHHHGLGYWLDYVRSLGGADAAVVVVQAKCDRESDRANAPLPAVTGFTRPLPQVTCSAKEGEFAELKAAIRSATRYLLEQHGTYRLPTSWVAVRDRLRELKATEKTLSWERFEALCQETHGTSNARALLEYLHRCGEVFHRKGLFSDDIVLDQEWAVRAIYAVLDRQGSCQGLRRMGGVFTLSQLDHLVWRGEFSLEAQKTILGMMQSCAVCYPLDQRNYALPAELRRYVAPDLLPVEAEVQGRVEALWRADVKVRKVALEYAFLHEGILRQFLCQIGALAGPDGAFWRYGCCFYDAATHSRARVRAVFTGTAEAPAQGRIVIETCEGNARELLARLQEAILRIRIGQAPTVVVEAEQEAPAVTSGEGKPLAETLQIAPAPTAKPLVYFSYAWGGEKEAMVERLEARLIAEGYEVKRDKRSMRPGDWISDFMREIGRAKTVCVVLSPKYLKSVYCMRELLYLYQSSLGEKSAFLERIVPLVVDEVPISTTVERLAHVRHWQTEMGALKKAMEGLDPTMVGGAYADLITIQDFCHHTEQMLRYVSDTLMPRGIERIEEDGFRVVLERVGR